MSFTHPLPRGHALRVGRGSRVAIRIDDPSVSREHAEVVSEGDIVFIEDLGSSNGTQIHRPASGQKPGETVKLKPHQRYAVRPGDVVRLGGVPALVQMERASVEADTSTTPPIATGAGRILLDPEMKRVYELAARAARSDIAVLIMGETGAGKELLAAAVHENSRRSHRPFLQLNCAALAETLLESELFGHEKGAFTGANVARQGLLESAQGGTVFLDELGEMPLATQAKLLRVLEDRQIRRLGSTRKLAIDVRFVAATNRDMSVEVAQGRFREDLFYRISGISLTVPPLRERRSEIEPLARYFLMAFCLKSGIGIPEISAAGLQRLLSYSWPGNVRELKNAMERAPFLSGGAPLGPEHLPSDNEEVLDFDAAFPEESTDVRAVPEPGIPTFRGNASETERLRALLEMSSSSHPPFPLGRASPGQQQPANAPVERAQEALTEVLANTRQDLPRVAARPVHGNSKNFSEEEERRRVTDALDACSGNQTRAAAMLGISRRTLINRIEAFGIPRPRKQS